LLERKIDHDLAVWKNEGTKKALLIDGARQTGKTFTVREFAARNYSCFLEINFVTMPSAYAAFEGDLNANTIITALTAFSRQQLVPHKTLVFLDEIQECPRARTAVKFLVEDGRFDYIESGSLLGIRYKPVPSYPVGYETQLRMFPLDFEEFLTANNVQSETVSYLRTCFEKSEPVSDAVHTTIMQLFRYYVITGGMPDAVQRFVDTHDIAQVVRIQNDILALYRQDIAKYAVQDRQRIRDIFDRLPSELNTKNRRFMLADIDPSARMNRYESSFMWLSDAGVVLPCYNAAEPKTPLKINELRNLIKVFMNDTGLLCAASIENVQYEILKGNLEVNMGSILENTIAEQLAANGFELCYFDRKNFGEVDFLLQQGGAVLPVEVKSGASYKKHRGLDHVMQSEEWKIGKAYVLCSGNVENADNVTYEPWYMAMFIKQQKLPEEMKVSVDLHLLEK
jgi:uncharacterized protein